MLPGYCIIVTSTEETPWRPEMSKSTASHKIPYRVSGIPCLIGVMSYNRQEPNYTTWDSDSDYYGFTECEWEVLDRKGYVANWLDKKITPEMEDTINAVIDAYFQQT